MSEIFAEATVTLRPDTAGFAKELQSQVKAIIDRIEASSRAPKIRVAPALSKNFIGSLRDQANAAVLRAQRGVQPLRVNVALGPIPTAQLREIQRASLAVGSGTTLVGTIAADTRDLAAANTALVPSQQRINALFARGAADLSAFSNVQDEVDKKRKRSAGAASSQSKQTSNQIREAASAQRLLNSAETDRLASLSALLPAEQRLSAARSALTGFSRAQAEAERVLASSTNLSKEARAELGRVSAVAGGQVSVLGRQIQDEAAARDRERAATKLSSQALRENASEMTRAARSQAQLRRGALATSLSFLGIRGATLAASASFLAGAAAIAVFARALDNATRFTDQLNVFRATTSSTVEELEQVREVARALGADLTLPGVTASDAAEAMTELAKAGLDVQNAIAGARGVLQLATAAAIQNAQAVELVANALNAFGLQGEDATRVADTFANAANAAQGSIVDIGIAFQQAAAAGRQVGLSFEDTTTFLTVLQREGLRGSDAGTSLRTALIRLIRPTKEAAAEIQKLGIQIRDANGNLRPDIFIQIAQLTRNLTKAERDRVIALVGGQDAFRAISILGRQSIQDFIRLRRELREQGTAGELAAARMQGLRGSLEGLSNLLSGIGIRIGQAVTPGIQSMVDSIAAATAAMASSESVALAFGGTLTFVAESAGLLATTLGALGTVALPAVRALGGALNTIGVANILALVAAYKLLPAVLARAAAAQRAFAIGAAQAAAAGRSAALGAALPLTTRLSALASGANLATLAISAFAAGLFFLITRETAAERATRRLTEATNELVDAQSRLRQARETRQSAGTSVNQAVLDAVNAREAVAVARARVQNAERGTPERVRAVLEYRVALDSLAAAQQRAAQAEKALADARLIEANAVQRAKDAREADTESLRESARAARERARAAVGRGPDAGRTPARLAAESARLFSESIDEQIRKLRESDDADALRHANRLARLKLFIALTGQVPDEKAFDIVVNAPNLTAVTNQLITEFGLTADELKRRLVDALSGPETTAEMRAAALNLLNQIAPPMRNKALEIGIEGGRNLGRGIADGVQESGDEIVQSVADVLTNAIAEATRRAQRGATRLTLAQGQGAALSTQLGIARQILADANARLANARRLLGRGESPSRRKEFDAAAEAQAAAFAQVQSLEEQIAGAAKKAADDAKDAADKADQAILDRLENRRTRVENKLADAQETETLADDIKFSTILRNLIRRQINRIKDLVKDRETQIQAIRALQQIELSLGREITSLQKQRRQQIADRAAEAISLDIEFAQITENPAAEIRARLKEIARLKKLQALAKNDILERKRLRNLIAQQQKAIEELTKAQRDKNNAFQTLAFEFLTTQQGFAANLLGNLLPSGAVGGTVGAKLAASGPAGGNVQLPGGPQRPDGGAPFQGRPGMGGDSPGARLEEASRLSEARAQQDGFTAGQAATLIYLTRQIVQLLGGIDTKGKHPEARRAQRTGAAAMDVM